MPLQNGLRSALGTLGIAIHVNNQLDSLF